VYWRARGLRMVRNALWNDFLRRGEGSKKFEHIFAPFAQFALPAIPLPPPHHPSPMASPATRGLRILVSGASGMVGKALVETLSRPTVLNAFRPEVYTLVRRQPANDREVWWDPYEARIDLKKCEGIDAVVHLAGEFARGAERTQNRDDDCAGFRVYAGPFCAGRGRRLHTSTAPGRAKRLPRLGCVWACGAPPRTHTRAPIQESLRAPRHRTSPRPLLSPPPAGENIGSGDGPLAFTGRWTERKKHKIMESRRRGTLLLSQALASLQVRPKVLVAASGVGFYGSAGEAVLTESSPKGMGFLSDVADAAEANTARAKDAGIRVVSLRLGVVLSRKGGVVEKLYWPYFFGGGGPVGSGQQWMTWIELDDAVRAIRHIISKPDLVGPVNCCSPNPVRNRDFASAFGGAMGRPAIVPLPEAAVRAVFGEMGEETLLVSQRGYPKKLLESGFDFSHPEIGEALATAVRG
jgi:uncharacterized protein (TIGR01777 family)